jgi:hypothetical protein
LVFLGDLSGDPVLHLAPQRVGAIAAALVLLRRHVRHEAVVLVRSARGCQLPLLTCGI